MEAVQDISYFRNLKGTYIYVRGGGVAGKVREKLNIV